MTEPAKVHRIPNGIFSVEIPNIQPMTEFFVNNVDMTPLLDNTSFSSRTLPLRKFGKQMTIEHGAYYEMSREYLDMSYQEFYNGLVDNCKTLFIQEPKFDVFYDSLQHKDIVSWSVLAGSDQIEFFKDLFTGPPEIREVEVEILVPVYPQTIRDCIKQMWTIIKRKFRHE